MIRIEDFGTYSAYAISGCVLLIDNEDALKLFGLAIHVATNGYAKIGSKRKGKSIGEYVHREVIQCPSGKEVDHINGNRLDCRKINLRICSHAENTRNICRRSNNTSTVTGVSWDKARLLWRAQISIGNRMIVLGRFREFDDAVKARKEAEEKYHGNFRARYNAEKNSV